MGAEARARRGRLLEAQEEAEREAKQEAAAEAPRLAAAGRAQEVAARVAAAAKAREEAVAAAARADALERAIADEADYGKGGGSEAAGPSKASEAVVPNQCICSITAEIMTNPVTTVSLALRPR